MVGWAGVGIGVDWIEGAGWGARESEAHRGSGEGDEAEGQSRKEEGMWIEMS